MHSTCKELKVSTKLIYNKQWNWSSNSLLIKKTSGLHRITPEFYQTIKEDLTPMLLKLFYKIEGKGMLPYSFYESRFTMMLKSYKVTTKYIGKFLWWTQTQNFVNQTQQHIAKIMQCFHSRNARMVQHTQVKKC
jgi:hypothetical protein